MWRPEQPLGNHRPPYPTEDLMRCSLIFQRMNLGKGHEAEKPTEETTMQKDISRGKGPTMDTPMMQDNDFDLLGLDLNPDLI